MRELETYEIEEVSGAFGAPGAIIGGGLYLLNNPDWTVTGLVLSSVAGGLGGSLAGFYRNPRVVADLGRRTADFLGNAYGAAAAAVGQESAKAVDSLPSTSSGGGGGFGGEGASSGGGGASVVGGAFGFGGGGGGAGGFAGSVTIEPIKKN